MIGLRKYKSASLRLATPMGVPEDMRKGIVEVVEIKSSNHGKGHATSLMKRVCDEATVEGLVLMLQVGAFDDGLTDAQLMKWYGKFGFMAIQDDPVLMARPPFPGFIQ